ncbi:DUF4355 domain-containing protein [Pediococcus stilesii]|nr:DUF4355 domain-containing protein [Pediococcus stilesii]
MKLFKQSELDNRILQMNLQFFAEPENGGGVPDPDPDGGNGGKQEPEPITQDKLNEIISQKLAKERSKFDKEKEKDIQAAIAEHDRQQQLTDEQKRDEQAKEFEKLKSQLAQRDILDHAKDYASEKGLPASLVGYFLGEDDDKTKANLDTFADEFSKAVQAGIDERFKQTKTPGTGSNGAGSSSDIELAKKLAKNVHGTQKSSYFG